MSNINSGGSGGGGGTATPGGDVQTSGADARSNTANAQTVESRLMGYNGSTWDRIRTGVTTAISTFTGYLNAISMGVYNSSLPTLTTGQALPVQLDVNGRTIITAGTLNAGEDLTNDVQKVELRYSYTHVAAGQATTTIKSGAGFLQAIVFNSAATATNVTTVYDNTAGSGTVIAIPAATTATILETVAYNVSFGTGLTVVTATANGSDMTFVWR